MAQNFRKIVDGINVVPKTTSTVNSAGDIDFDTTNNKLNLHNGTVASPIVTESGTATLTNKTISATSNTITNLTNANLSGSAGITGANIASNTIANSNLANMPAHTIKGNNTASSATPLDLTGTQVTAELDVFTSSLKGLVPASGGGATLFLNADGSFTAPVTGTVGIGTYDSQAPSVNGLVSAAGLLYAQSASSTVPGMVNTTTQSFQGAKTFNSPVSLTTINSLGSGVSITPANNENLTLTTAATGRLRMRGVTGIEMEQLTSPISPASGYDSLYFKSDDLLYSKNAAGVEREIGGGANSAGMITMFGGVTAPTGYFICNGMQVSRTTYSALYAILGDSYGSGDGSTTFNIPDLRGQFTRGYVGTPTTSFIDTDVNDTTDEITISAHGLNRTGFPIRFDSGGLGLPSPLAQDTTYYAIYIDDNTIQVAASESDAISGVFIDITDQGPAAVTFNCIAFADPDYSLRTASTNGGNITTGIGSSQIDELESHNHVSVTPKNSGIGGATYVTNAQTTPVFDAYGTTFTGGNETRPKNIYVNYIIKY